VALSCFKFDWFVSEDVIFNQQESCALDHFKVNGRSFSWFRDLSGGFGSGFSPERPNSRIEQHRWVNGLDQRNFDAGPFGFTENILTAVNGPAFP
jgi:hypothetical protein